MQLPNVGQAVLVGQLDADGQDAPVAQLPPVGQVELVMQPFTVGMLEPVII